MKNCLLCGQPFSGKRKDALYCSGTCKAKYSELKKNNGLSGLQLQPEQNFIVDKPTNKISYANTVDAIDLEPFANLLGDFDEVDFNTAELNKENNSSELNTGNLGKEVDDTEETEDPKPEIIMPSQYVTREVKHSSFLYQYLQSELAACRNEIKKCEAKLAHINALITDEQNKDGAGYLMTGAGIGFGLPLAYNYFKNNEDTNPIEPDKIEDKNGKLIPFLNNKNRQLKSSKKATPKKSEDENKTGFSFWEITLLGLIGTGVGYIGKSSTEASREAEKAKKLQSCKALLTEYTPLLNAMKAREANLLKEIQNTPAYFTKQVQAINPIYTIVQSKIAEGQQKEAQRRAKSQNAENQSQEDTMDYNNDLSGISGNENITDINEVKNKNDSKQPKNLETDKIFTMKKVSQLKHQVLNFTGKWLDFFGQPQTNFFCVIHGMSGEGKSHFALQFGKYLSERFGSVLYFSGEEGFANTFLQKINDMGVGNNSRYYASEIKKGAELLADVPNQYHFIIMDSLTNMNIDVELMRTIRAKYKQSGIIAICQSTKDGKIRGSYEIVHDSDIAVKVVNGIATTTKNRFKEKHQDFNVFAVYDKKSKPTLPLNKNKNEDRYLGEDFDNTVV